MQARRKVLDYLDQMGLACRISEHPAVYTIEEMEKLGLDKIGAIVKNLFLRDAKGKRHFLVMMRQDKKVDLKGLQAKIGSTPLRFASEERLEKCLGLTKGAVSPFGILNDENKAVEIIIDRELRSATELLGVHPNDNTATVWMSMADLERVMTERGNAFAYLDI
ncbi:MAG: prolyl-tRNA synthetase associated domain-containing protein [Candidatus Adiutrix sp.]|jgi:Ala-tRNA(Pro) deacylase|nr:prolyl-tRNA synthetase associated domain-containing protein [Candidatus Adiutrix sp.]